MPKKDEDIERIKETCTCCGKASTEVAATVSKLCYLCYALTSDKDLIKVGRKTGYNGYVLKCGPDHKNPVMSNPRLINRVDPGEQSLLF